jgi:small subunit ribosomal protein S1
MSNEAGMNTQELGSEESMNEEDFASLLEESLKEHFDESRSDGVIVEIKDDVALIDVGKKQEGLLNLDEIRDAEGELQYNVGDQIKVVISGYRNEKPIISHTKALVKEKTDEYIKTLSDESEALIEGKIVGKNKGGYIVENSEKIQFFLPKSQASFKDDKNTIGKEVKAKIAKVDHEKGSIVISRKKYLNDIRKKKKEAIGAVLEATEPIEGVIKKITTYGMFVNIGDVDGLVHYSEISYKGPVNPSTVYKEGESVLVKAINYDKEKRHLSLSIKAAQPDPWEEIKDVLEAGDTIQVEVSNIEPYGVFVDLGNDIEGFLHISEISWDKNIKHPKDYLEVGQEINVEVIEIEADKKRLRVSLKSLLPKPFQGFVEKYREGDVVTGSVVTITKFGAFVKVDGCEGLLHNEEITWDKSANIKDIINVGDEVEVKIVKIDRENEKISFSKKVLDESPVEAFANANKVGDIVQGTIKDIKEFGIFVKLTETIDALIRVEDLENKNLEEYNKGDDIEAVIANIDKSRNKIRLSVNRLNRAKEREILNQINSDDGRTTLGDILKDQF